MEKVYLVGNKSNIPYQKNTVHLFDSSSGACLINNGWGIISMSTGKGYEINVYDGIIDFYKAIENKSITDVGISELNHLKNVPKVIASFTDDTLPYKYIAADYNGKVYYAGNLNIDYLVPSARISYIWNRVHAFAGFTFEGVTFQTEKFLNHFITYPKPVPVNTAKTTEITSQNSEIIVTPITYTTGSGGIFYGETYNAVIFPQTFDEPDADNIPGHIRIDTSGAYRLTCVGSFSNNFGTDGLVNWSLRDSSNVIKAEGQIDGQISQSVVIPADATDKIYLYVMRTGQNAPELYNQLTGSMHSDLVLIEGYDANFDDVFIDFSAKDFINDIMTHYALTPFKDKYKNHIVYLTLDEVLQNSKIEDWSDLYCGKINEKYSLGGYAQKNLFKYKYNDGNENHKDGYIRINDVNLNDETTIISSKIYAPEKAKNISFLGFGSNVYKIWDKEVKDDGEVDYRELSGRFYYLRFENKDLTLPMTIVSESLNTSEEIEMVSLESDYRLSFQHVIYDNYPSIASILDKSKLLECEFYLKPKDYERFDFKKLIYVRQLASYYLVNKIPNFIKGKKTKCEIIEVDYLKRLVAPEVEAYIAIMSIEYSACMSYIGVDSNIVQPFNVQIIPYKFAANPSGDMAWIPYETIAPVFGAVDANVISFMADFLPYSPFGYRFVLKYLSNVFEEATSLLSEAVIVEESCVVTSDLPSVLTIDNVIFLGTTPNFPFTNHNYKIFYTYDALPPGTLTYTLRIWGYIALLGWTYTDYIKIPDAIGGPTGTDGEQQTYFGYSPTKIKIQILDKESLEHTI